MWTAIITRSRWSSVRDDAAHYSAVDHEQAKRSAPFGKLAEIQSRNQCLDKDCWHRLIIGY
jgi:hypothetical protein